MGLKLARDWYSIVIYPDAKMIDQVADLKAGLYYVNIHTKEYPNGAIRGQLSAKE